MGLLEHGEGPGPAGEFAGDRDVGDHGLLGAAAEGLPTLVQPSVAFVAAGPGRRRGRLRRQAAEVRRIIGEAGGRQVRVFGSVAIGSDTEESDIDLLFTMDSPLSLMQLNALSDRIGALLEASVDLVPNTALSPLLRDRVLAEAVPL